MKVSFRKFEIKDLDYWNRWIKVPHVKQAWFWDGYDASQKILQKILGNGHDYPFVITCDGKSIGYVQACNLDEYYKINPNVSAVFKGDGDKKFGIDLFIADENFLNKGVGTELIKKFTKYIFDNFDCEQIFIDPLYDNKRAIRCYEKAGFEFIRFDNDEINNQICLMRMAKN